MDDYDKILMELDKEIQILEMRKSALLQTKEVIDKELVIIEDQLKSLNEYGSMVSKAQEKAEEEYNKMVYGI
ncbi:MAG: hypothetical protein BV457_08590 [Thermoplasmata archaeon M9B1D]|nr:MAG: hypothetical protein BV457_08590 [Thermoplasmata archaeon M9B1D]